MTTSSHLRVRVGIITALAAALLAVGVAIVWMRASTRRIEFGPKLAGEHRSTPKSDLKASLARRPTESSHFAGESQTARLSGPIALDRHRQLALTEPAAAVDLAQSDAPSDEERTAW